MAASANMVAYKVVFFALGCFMLATLIYTTVTDGSPFRIELLTPWMVATLIDFYVNVVAIVAWVAYKEPTWMKAFLWVILLVCFGSLATCAYITLKLFNITSQHLQDPVSQLLLRKDHEHNVKCSSIMIGRVLFSTLGIVVLVVVVYTVITDGLPFRTELLTPWMAATLIDFYINVFAISVWVVHKESTWISAFFWICLLICFGSSGEGIIIRILVYRSACRYRTVLSKTNTLYHNVCLHCHSTSPALIGRSNVPCFVGLPQQAWKYICQVIFKCFWAGRISWLTCME
ncbi:uncharacterized protein LOC103991200 isoform X2 [Musa acuminata AAA Group]|uniref:uncharacterized protein LOC103991200 isoform X2 n=1 Tax=Musa acuminata AAA Group TaxID=214697 RepID=UPI0031D002C5